MKYWLLILSIASVFIKVKCKDSKLFIENDDNSKVWMPNERRIIKCTSKANKTIEKVKWISPEGVVVVDRPLRRVYSKKTVQSSATDCGVDLIFSRTSIKDNGVWLCKSGNLIQQITVCVVDPTKLYTNDATLSVNIGSSIKLRCNANWGEPEPRLQWYRKGQIVTDNDSSKYKTLITSTPTGIEGQLTVVSIEDEDAGLYVCQAIQESNESCILTSSMNITLEVQSSSKEISTADNIEENVLLACIPKMERKFQNYGYGGDNISIENSFIDLSNNKNSLLYVTGKNVGKKLIYVAKEQTPVDSVTTNGLLNLVQINEQHDNDSSSKIYIILLDYNITESKDLYVEYLQTDTLYEHYITRNLDWKSAIGKKIRFNDVACNNDQHLVLEITYFLEGLDYYLRLRTESETSTKHQDDMTTVMVDTNHSLNSSSYHHTSTKKYLLDFVQERDKYDLILLLSAVTIILIAISLYVICKFM